MSKRILVIDDDEAVRKSFILALDSTEYKKVDLAESGEEGIKMLRDAKYDLIYLDLKMPGMNGVETLRKLRKMDKHVPVYIITSFHKEYFDQLISAKEDGIDFELIRKPIDSEQIYLVTRGVLKEPTRY